MSRILFHHKIKTVTAGVLGTSVMTLFSYFLSTIVKDDVKEPKLLGKMIHRLLPGVSRTNSRISGWVVHYAVGLLFAELYIQLWEKTKVKPNYKTGFILGGFSGIATILIWKITLKLHPVPPSVNFKKHALNLFFAHVVFGLFAVVGYSWYELQTLLNKFCEPIAAP